MKHQLEIAVGLQDGRWVLVFVDNFDCDPENMDEGKLQDAITSQHPHYFQNAHDVAFLHLMRYEPIEDELY